MRTRHYQSLKDAEVVTRMSMIQDKGYEFVGRVLVLCFYQGEVYQFVVVVEQEFERAVDDPGHVRVLAEAQYTPAKKHLAMDPMDLNAMSEDMVANAIRTWAWEKLAARLIEVSSTG